MKKFFLLLTALLLILSLAGCKAGSGSKPVIKTDFVMDTVASIAVYDEMPETEADKLLTEAFKEIRRYEGLFSAETEGSDVYKINNSKGEKVKVSEETAELIDIALKYSKASGGAFDITIRPVSRLWDFKSEKKSVPDDASIKEALKHVGYGNVVLDREQSTVSLKDSEAEIDLGAIAKGYTGDRIKEFLIDRGVKSAVINLGGNVVLIGSKPDGSSFKVGIEKPFGNDGEMTDTIEGSDVSVVTSGNYERYFKTGNKLYHHILDTKTGYPVESGLNSVTIISGRSVDGDALSTACFCLGYDSAKELLSNIDDPVLGSIFLDNDNKAIR